MVDLETKQKFIELRAKGISYEKIAKELNVSKQTLLTWNKELEKDINNLKETEISQTLELYNISKLRRIEILGKNINKIYQELEKRSF